MMISGITEVQYCVAWVIYIISMPGTILNATEVIWKCEELLGIDGIF